MGAYLTLTRRELAAYFLSITGYVIIAAALFLLGFSFVVLLVNLQQEPTPMPLTELFYITPNQQIMVASYTTDGGSFTASKAQAWWSGRILPRPRGPYALHPDGNRFAVSIAQDATTKRRAPRREGVPSGAR